MLSYVELSRRGAVPAHGIEPSCAAVVARGRAIADENRSASAAGIANENRSASAAGIARGAPPPKTGSAARAEGGE